MICYFKAACVHSRMNVTVLRFIIVQSGDINTISQLHLGVFPSCLAAKLSRFGENNH